MESNPVAELDNAAWALAAVIATCRAAAASSLAAALTADPDRTAVLEAVGLVARTADGLTPHPVLPDGPVAANAAMARLSSLRQAVAVAAGEGTLGWAAQLARRLATPASRVLDIGTGVAALALALVRDLPQIQVTAIDILERAMRLAGAELEQAGPLARRVELRLQDVADLREQEAYDLIWLPAPFLSAESLHAALLHVVDALTPGGWLVAETNPAPGGEPAAAVARWNAIRTGGNYLDADALAAALLDLGLDDVQRHATVPGGPVLVAGQRPGRVRPRRAPPRRPLLPAKLVI